uniref:Uncharacterized protein n=1 Tax=Timema douglasi TaxID=61478 RepID=A0A7R8VE10_TIMDO|nr:unnamed protein product [Timema douglasi]
MFLTFFSILYDYAQLLVELKYKHANIIYNRLTALLFFLLFMSITTNAIFKKIFWCASKAYNTVKFTLQQINSLKYITIKIILSIY